MSDTVGPEIGALGERAGPGERSPRDDSARTPEPLGGDGDVSRRGSTALWMGALLFGGAATAALVLSDDARLLRLGLVAALWAALAGAFAVARLRGQVSRARERARDDQRIYELELEREIAAREQYEAKAHADAYRQAAEDSGAQLQALQAEMERLRTTLEQVVGGDVLFEHVALRAESTRVRSLDQSGGQMFGGRDMSEALAGAGKASGIQRGFPQRGVRQQPHVQQAFRAADYSSAQSAGVPVTGTHEPVHGSTQHGSGRTAAGQGAGMPPPEADQQPAGARRSPGTDPVSETGLIPPAQDADQEPERFGSGRSGPVRAEGTLDAGSTSGAEGAGAEDPGAHTAGTSVEDLLAAYGSSGDPPPRRRRRA